MMNEHPYHNSCKDNISYSGTGKVFQVHNGLEYDDNDAVYNRMPKGGEKTA